MVDRLLAISLVILVVFSSIGLRVMHHHCVWCGDHPIEIVYEAEAACHTDTCCTPPEEPVQSPCRHESCCKEVLMKIDNALLSAENLQLKQPVIEIRTLDFIPVVQLSDHCRELILSDRIDPPTLPTILTNPIPLIQSWRC